MMVFNGVISSHPVKATCVCSMIWCFVYTMVNILIKPYMYGECMQLMICSSHVIEYWPMRIYCVTGTCVHVYL